MKTSWETAGFAAGRPVPRVAETRITSLVCPTRGSARPLRRALTSYGESLARHGRDVEIVVSDDAAGPGARQAMEAVRTDLRRRFGVRVAYLGIEVRTRLAAELARVSGVAPGLVRFALFGAPRARVTTGANRNALLLLTTGQAVLSVDDDTLCWAAATPGAEAGVRLLSEDRFSSSHPAEVWPFRDLDAALGALQPNGLDPIAMHERFLGRSIEPGPADAGPGVEAGTAGVPRGTRGNHPAAAVSSARATGPRGVVRATLNGFVGEHTWPSAIGYLFLTGPSLERLTSSPSRYRAALAGRCVVKAVRRVTIVDRCHHAPMPFVGLDHRELLPPYLPVGRGQDVLWWETLAQAFEGAWVAHLPFVMVHAPPARRGLDLLGMLRTVSRLPLNRVIAALVRGAGDAPPQGSSPPRSDAEGLRRLGARLAAIGRAPAATFAVHARELIRRDLATLFDHLERRLEEAADVRRPWRRDVGRFLWVARRALSRDDVFLPWDLADVGGRGAPRERLQRLVRDHGELIEAWPDLVAASRTLQARERPGPAPGTIEW